MGIRIILKNKEEVTAKAMNDIRRLEAQKSITNTRIARYLQAQARLRAPFKTGKLANSIKVKPLTKGNVRVMVTAKSISGFPYPKWVNQDPGYTVLTYKKGGPKNMGLKPGDVAVYGSIPSHWNWTGTPRFFDLAKQETLKRWKGIALKGYNKALGAKIGGG